MTKGIFIVGTDTDVGKTIVTAGLMYLLRSRGYNATYFKAALSGVEIKDSGIIYGDTTLVSEVSDLKEGLENITPYIYRTAVSPHLAAKIESNPIRLERINEKYNYLKEKYDFIIAEGSGGIVCPLIDDETGVYLLADLVKELNMNVVVVARAGLGTINHTVLTIKYIESLGIKVKGIIINGYKDTLLCNDNIEVIKKLTKVPILAVMNWIDDLEKKATLSEKIRNEAEKSINIYDFINNMEEI